jgi:nitrous oxide reductase accessory protein NosL
MPQVTKIQKRSRFDKLRRYVCYVVAAVAVVSLFGCGGTAPGPVQIDASEGYCPVCKMKVRASDPFASELIYADNKKLMFESQGDMLRFYFSHELPKPETYQVPAPQSDRNNITKILVRDYNTRKQLDGRNATLVYKSKVTSPMGKDVFAFDKREDAEAFASVNGGLVLTFGSLTPALVQDLRKD